MSIPYEKRIAFRVWKIKDNGEMSCAVSLWNTLDKAAEIIEDCKDLDKQFAEQERLEYPDSYYGIEQVSLLLHTPDRNNV